MSSVELRRKPVKLVGEDDTTASPAGAHGSVGESESLGPVPDLARLRCGEITREAYVRQYGHRFADDSEASAPRPAEDPQWSPTSVRRRRTPRSSSASRASRPSSAAATPPPASVPATASACTVGAVP